MFMNPHNILDKQYPSSSPPTTHFTPLSPDKQIEPSGHITINKKRKWWGGYLRSGEYICSGTSTGLELIENNMTPLLSSANK